MGAFKQKLIQAVNGAMKGCTDIGLNSCSVWVQGNLIVLIGEKKVMAIIDKMRKEYTSNSLQTIGLVGEILRNEIKRSVEEKLPIHIKSVFKDFDYEHDLSLVVIMTEENIPEYLNQLTEL